MSNQSSRQASVRAVTNTQFTYEGDWHALFNVAGIPEGTFNERFLAWLNLNIPQPRTNLLDAMASYAVNVAGVSSWNEVRSINGLIPPTPGPLDFTSSQSTNSLSVTFDLAAPIAALGIIVAYEGTLTNITATHGGQSLSLERIDNNTTTSLATAMFTGNGLTIESASLVITLVGGAVGKAWIGRINDDYGYSVIASGWKDGDTGENSASKTMTISGVDGTGRALSVWGTSTNNGRAGFAMPLADYTTQFSAIVVGGDKTAVTGWSTVAGWSEAGGVYTHAGANSAISKVLTPNVEGPLGFDADVTLAAGASMMVMFIPVVGTPTQRTIYGPYTGKWSALSDELYTFQALAVYASGNATITNMNYIVNPRYLQGVISRSNGVVANGQNLTWGSVNVSKFATTAIEVHSAPYDPDAMALFARMTVQPNDARKLLISTTITNLKNAGFWSKLDLLYLTAAHDAQSSRLNWKQNAFDLNAIASPTFVADRGYTSDGSSSYLTTNWSPGTGGPYNYTLNDASAGSWANTDLGSGTTVDFGYINAFIRPRAAGNFIQTRCNDTVNMSGVTSVVTAIGMTSVSRNNALDYLQYKNGSQTDVITQSSTTLLTSTFFLCALNSNGSPAAYSFRQLSFGFAGSYLTPTEMMSLYNIIGTYRTGVGL